MIDWNPLVNKRFSLDGDVSLQNGYIEEIKFESGKTRTWLRNTFVPYVYPLKLALNNKTITKSGKTEYEEFNDWYNKTLRYGILPFQVGKIGHKTKRIFIKTEELGVYRFTDTPKFDKIDGIPIVSFTLEEMRTIPEVEYIFFKTKQGQILFSKKKRAIVV